MSFSVIDKNAEDMLYALLIAEEQKASMTQNKLPNMHFLQCNFFHIAHTPEANDLEYLHELMPNAEEPALYICSDGDVIIKWVDGEADILDSLKHGIIEKYGKSIQKYMNIKDFLNEYDLIEGRGKLKAECSKKLKRQTKHAKELSKYFKDERIITTFAKTMRLITMQRSFRSKPHILIVEDQIFSQKLLTTILKDYTCHIAATSGDAILKYMEKCPDIVFLDVELPDLSGHSVAKFIKKIDDDAYVVMVTGNQYEADIKAAKENKVKGFIAKPYKKETILNSIEQYYKAKKRKK